MLEDITKTTKDTNKFFVPLFDTAIIQVYS